MKICLTNENIMNTANDIGTKQQSKYEQYTSTFS